MLRYLRPLNHLHSISSSHLNLRMFKKVSNRTFDSFIQNVRSSLFWLKTTYCHLLGCSSYKPRITLVVLFPSSASPCSTFSSTSDLSVSETDSPFLLPLCPFQKHWANHTVFISCECYCKTFLTCFPTSRVLLPSTPYLAADLLYFTTK